MAIGSGLLIGSVAYDLVADAQACVRSPCRAVRCCRRGSLRPRQPAHRATRRGPAQEPVGPAQRDGGASPSDNPLAIVLGSALDGIPESFVLGLSVLHGGVSVPLLVGIGLSNLPEGMAASSGLRARGWPQRRVLGMWAVVVAVSAVSAALGHELLATDDGTLAAVVQTFAAGALLAMIADTMVPESYEVEREWTGGLVVAGFSLSLLIAAVLGSLSPLRSVCFAGKATLFLEPRQATRERADRHHGDVPPHDLRARGGGHRPDARSHRGATEPERPDRVADRRTDGARRPARRVRRPAPRAHAAGRDTATQGDAQAPAGRVPARRGAGHAVGGGPRGGLPLGARHERVRRAATAGGAAQPDGVPVRQPDPGPGRAAARAVRGRRSPGRPDGAAEPRARPRTSGGSSCVASRSRCRTTPPR